MENVLLEYYNGNMLDEQTYSWVSQNFTKALAILLEVTRDEA
ncbi:hypothetical protein L248_3165 [Schleiferilactobacillus shenzhenensis LY-73]|uniref:Uncharacterized protein n=1 Tax=Schleiferilactobacillus shenzhenensis LY-73 TaxID=1231336 RepID=U4TSZ3_9LACO|nr:hypothetical protein L248_3165 [Schleiferilactobacillus shenzhenensis LY-73]